MHRIPVCVIAIHGGRLQGNWLGSHGRRSRPAVVERASKQEGIWNVMKALKSPWSRRETSESSKHKSLQSTPGMPFQPHVCIVVAQLASNEPSHIKLRCCICSPDQ
eukprot:scaffold12805_cov17-Tisochrysis_lutea.AAC.1